MTVSWHRSAFAQELLTALNERRSPLQVELQEHGVIVAKHVEYSGPSSVSVTFLHPEGDIVIGSDWPSRAELLGLEPKELLMLSYAELAEMAYQNHGCEWRQLEDSLWLDPNDPALTDCFDTDGRYLLESPALRSQLVKWLREEDEWAPYIDGLLPELHEGLVGYATRDGLPEAEVKRLSLKARDFRGGPGCYAERVAYRGEPAVLEASLRRYGLPFTLSAGEEVAS